MEVRRSINLPVSAARAWEALTDEEDLATWLGDEVALDLRPGGLGVVRDDDGVTRLVEVDEVERGRRVVLRWWPEAGGEAGGRGASRVELRLEATEEGSRLTIVETLLVVPGGTGADRASAEASWAGARAAHWEARLARVEARARPIRV